MSVLSEKKLLWVPYDFLLPLLGDYLAVLAILREFSGEVLCKAKCAAKNETRRMNGRVGGLLLLGKDLRFSGNSGRTSILLKSFCPSIEGAPCLMCKDIK